MYAVAFLGAFAGAISVGTWCVIITARARRRKAQQFAAMYRGSELRTLLAGSESRVAMTDAFERTGYGGIGIFYANGNRYCINMDPELPHHRSFDKRRGNLC
jgi:hypothetical protein